MPLAPTSLKLHALAQALTILAAAAAQAETPIPCDRVEAPWHAEAVAEVRRHMAATWLEIGRNYYSGYRMSSPPANPFDLTTQRMQPGVKQVEEGYIWIAGIACELSVAGDTEITVTLRAGATSFAEKGARWTPPMHDRQLTRFTLTQGGARWAVREHRGEDSVLTAEDGLRRPTAEELPSRSKKLAIPCGPEQVWERKRCIVAAKAKASSSF